MQIINYFAGHSVFESPLADVITQDKIKIFLDKEKAQINRPVETITLAEAKELEEYFKLLPDRRKYVK